MFKSPALKCEITVFIAKEKHAKLLLGWTGDCMFLSVQTHLHVRSGSVKSVFPKYQREVSFCSVAEVKWELLTWFDWQVNVSFSQDGKLKIQEENAKLKQPQREENSVLTYKYGRNLIFAFSFSNSCQREEAGSAAWHQGFWMWKALSLSYLPLNLFLYKPSVSSFFIFNEAS